MTGYGGGKTVFEEFRRGIKVSVARLLANEITGGWIGWWYGDRIPSRGLVMDTSGPAICNQIKAFLWWGLYESSEARAISHHLRTGIPVVELGASIGYVSALIACRSGGGRQLAVEANSDLLPVIATNLRLNSAEHVMVVNAAVDYSGAERITLRLGKMNTGSRVQRERDCVNAPGERTMTVPTVTLGGLLKAYGIQDYILVCDIEGAEAAMFEKEPVEIRSRCCQILAELHGTELNGRPLKAWEVARLVVERWGMVVTSTDGKVWVFDRL